MKANTSLSRRTLLIALVLVLVAVEILLLAALFPRRVDLAAEPVDESRTTQQAAASPADKEKSTAVTTANDGDPVATTTPDRPAGSEDASKANGDYAIALPFFGSVQVDAFGPQELQWEQQEPPVDEESIVLVEPPVPEKTGPVKATEEALPEQPVVSEDVVEECDRFYSAELTEEMRAKRNPEAPDVDFVVTVKGTRNPHPILLVPCMPKEKVRFDVVEASPSARFEVEVSNGEYEPVEERGWVWTAPAGPAIHCVKVRDVNSADTMCLHMAVLKSYSGASKIGKFQLGVYQIKPFRGNPRYKRPAGFIEVTRENLDTWVSPHFQLRQFLCKQKGGYPKYALVEPRLLLKLELLVNALQQQDIEATSLFVTSGFRTPWYNRHIGNKTLYSRHLYGDAADIYVDANRDGRMDDLDGSGKRDGGDAIMMHRIIDEIVADNEDLWGGLGLYTATRYANPFIHVDTRGYRARWGR